MPRVLIRVVYAQGVQGWVCPGCTRVGMPRVVLGRGMPRVVLGRVCPGYAQVMPVLGLF